MYLGKSKRNRQFQWYLYAGLFETACIVIEQKDGMKCWWERNEQVFSI